jgi:sigma-B regulation protein RsbU (phosphoserine phosphatase)
MKILVVDDERSIRLALSALLKKWGYQVLEAADGEEAWALLEREPINMVLCDWVMPRLDGLDLCRRLRATEFPYYIYLILLTGKDQTEDLYTAFNAGVDDFSTKPFNAKELRVRIKAGERVIGLEHRLNAKNAQLADANQALQQSQVRLQQDLEAAAAVQRSLMPTSDQTGLPLRLAWSMQPAEKLGGDIFNFHRLDDRRLAFYLIDVAGHGVLAAMFSLHLSMLLTPGLSTPGPADLFGHSSAGVHGSSDSSDVPAIASELALPASTSARPDEIVARLNQGFQMHERNSIYFTMVYGILDAYTGQGQLCQAGHPYPLLARRHGPVETTGGGGFPVGLIPDADFESVDFTLDPGDRLLIYSDGATECFNPERPPFGVDRLSALLQGPEDEGLDQVIAGIEQRLSAWRMPQQGLMAALDDDVSMLAIERVSH